MNAAATSGERGAALLLFLVVALAIGLRLTGLGFLLPQQSEPDGVVFDKQVQVLREGLLSQERQGLYGFYPHVVPRLAALLPERGASDPMPRTLAEHLEVARAHRLGIRFVVALLSVLAVPATWWLARRFLPQPWPHFAALLMATSVLDVWFAQEARPHAAETSFAFLAVIAAIEVRRRGRLREWIVAGLGAGLAIGTLQNGLAVLPALGLAAFLRLRSREDRGASRIVLGSLLALSICAACVRAFYPFLFHAGWHSKAGASKAESTLDLSGHLVELEKFNGKGFAVVARSLLEYDPLITGLAVLGLAFGALHVFARSTRLERSTRDALWIAAAFVVPYLLAIGLYERTYQRFALPLVPWMCVLGAFGAWRLVDLAAKRGDLARASAGALFLACAGLQAFGSWKLVRARAERDTIGEAAAWISEHVGPKPRVSVMTTLDLPLFQTQAARNANESTTLDVRYPWFTYQWHLSPGAFDGPAYELYAMPLSTEPRRAAARADVEGFLQAQDADWAVIEVFSDGRFPLLASIRDALQRNATLAARLSPDAVDVGENLPLVYQDDEYPYTTPWFWRVLRARCTGPIVEIYKLR